MGAHHHHRHHHNEQLSDRHSSLRALLLLVALSLHSLFEGLALGLLTSNDVIISIFSALMVRDRRPLTDAYVLLTRLLGSGLKGDDVL